MGLRHMLSASGELPRGASGAQGVKGEWPTTCLPYEENLQAVGISTSTCDCVPRREVTPQGLFLNWYR